MREQAVDAVEVACENLDVERVCQVGWVDERMVMRRGGGDVHIAAGEGVREHRDHGNEISWIGARACSGECRGVGVSLARVQEEGCAWGGEEIVGNEGILGLEVRVCLGCAGEERAERRGLGWCREEGEGLVGETVG